MRGDNWKKENFSPQARIQSPCYGCRERSAGCHGGCGRYAAYRSEVGAVTGAERKYRDTDNYVYTAVIKSRDIRKRYLNAERR